MSEGSIPPFGFRSFSGSLFKQTLGRLFKRSNSEPAAEPALASRVSAEIQRHAEAHAAIFDRAKRLLERAERLENEGIPAESARNRAERAKREAEATLLALRSRFAEKEGQKSLMAFDLEVRRRFPAFDVRG